MINHYFSSEEPAKSKPLSFKYIFNSNEYIFKTDAGVFSVGKMDKATDILLQNIPPLQGSLLDMGCGYGCIGIVLAKENMLELMQADVNPRAVHLTKENAIRNAVKSEVILSDRFSEIQNCFDTVVINPPIHAGKKIIFSMYEGAYNHLKPQGCLYIVVLKKHGAESNIDQLKEIFGNCDIIYKKKTCYVLCCTRF